MARRRQRSDGRRHEHFDGWTADPTRVHTELDPSGTGARQIRHPQYPNTYYLPDNIDEADLKTQLLTLVVDYVQKANVLLKLPDSWLVPGGGGGDPFFVQWLKFDDDLRGSYFTVRHDDPINATGMVDRTAVIMGSLAINAPQADGSSSVISLFGGQGLHAIAHIDPPSGGTIAVRFTSVGSTLPRFPFKLRAKDLGRLTDAFQLESDDVHPPFVIFTKIFIAFAAQMVSLFGLPAGTVPIEFGYRLAPGDSSSLNVEIISKTAPGASRRGSRKKGKLKQAASNEDFAPWMRESAYLLVARLTGGGLSKFDPVAKIPLMSHADADILPIDPVTQEGSRVFVATRPNRPSAAFAPYVDHVTLWNPTPSTKPNRVVLKDTGGNFQILKSPLAGESAPYTDATEVPKTVRADVRTNQFAAVNAYSRATEFTRRLLACGFNPKTDLRYLKFPLDVHYRGGIHPGGEDGQTVNAQVRWISPPVKEPGVAIPGTAEISFALADLRLNPRGARVTPQGTTPDPPSRAFATPLGIAADARWAWHEWCHVMLAGATGSLEFEFAHSAGDALAAILADPDSALATESDWRGRTFPWVTLPDRFHARKVTEGWGWTGTKFQRERFFAAARHECEKEAYWSEQIHSSTLFHLYRALGGDSETIHNFEVVPDRDLRGSVADYTVYLILRAILLMGSASTYPLPTADAFVTLLTDADAGSAGLQTAKRLFIGGAAGKVIRWAYERQGLYADPAAKYPVDAPGLPPPVDIYIEGQIRQKGGYKPLTYLNGDWHASSNAMRLVSAPNKRHATPPKVGVDSYLLVFLNNRGSVTSGAVTVNAWVAEVGIGGNIPGWHSAAWQPLNQTNAPGYPVVDPESGGGGPAGPWVFKWTPASAGKRYALLGEATCDEDPSNIDPATGLPCSTVTIGGADASDIDYIVSCDNNLGLIVVAT
jgi:hypothetical protein